MTRQIKFRGRKLPSGELLSFELGDIHGMQAGHLIVRHTGELVVIESSSVQQFTGLFDKNGKEIYEGDIVKGFDKGNWYVEWNENPAGFYLVAPEKIRNRYLLGAPLELEIIGNIYENKELLK